MKRKLFVGIAIALTLILALCFMVACSTRDNEEDTPGDGSGGEVTETVVTRTVEIRNGKGRSVYTYEKGAEISLKADLVANVQFVFWSENGEPFSYSRETTYVVEDDVILRAIYATEGEITIDANGGTVQGTLSNVEVILNEAKEGSSDKMRETNGALYVGYGYVLPVAERARYTFTGYMLGDEIVTDRFGRSLKEYDGKNSVFVAQFEEKDYVFVEVYNKETGALQKSEKVYLEDNAVTVTADDVTDRVCTGIVNEEGEEVSSTKTFTVDLTNKKETGSTVRFFATYREAYTLIVTSASGGGKYSMEENVAIAATIPNGNNFSRWNVEIADGSTFLLGYKVIDGEDTLCFIGEDAYVYYDDEREERVTVSLTEEELNAILAGTATDVRTVGQEMELTLTDLVRLGATVEGGARLLIRAEFKRKQYTLSYYVDCYVNGQYCLDAEGEAALEADGYYLSATPGVYVKEEYYDYNEDVLLSGVPAINHYKFINWQNAEQGEAVPSKVKGNFAVKGTFLPDSHKITVDCDATQGLVKIGSAGNVTTGYYDYGTTIEFYVRADAGYRFSKWLDVDGRVLSLPNVNTEEGVDIYYSFTYRVERDDTLNVRFTERGYIITYLLSVMYDGRDVTQDQTFFEAGGYVENYWISTEERNYGVEGGLKEKYKVKSATDPDGLPLVYGATNWTVSDWVCDTEIGDVNDFIMPKNNIVVRSVCRIESYPFSFTRQDGVNTYAVTAINGKDAEEYENTLGGLPVYTVPFGSEISMQITYGEGYTKGAIRVNGAALDATSDYVSSATDDRYVFNVGFSMLKSERRGANYVLHAETNYHSISYYLSWDFLHADDRVALADHFNIDLSRCKVWEGKSYYYVNKVLRGEEENEINQRDVTFYTADGTRTPIREADVSSDANAAMYNVTGWRKVRESVNGDTPYYEATMPDDDVWMYADLSLMKFTIAVTDRVFEFDDSINKIDSATVVRLQENDSMSEESYGWNNVFDYTKEYLYYSEITVQSFSPTGYDFSHWEMTSGTGADETTETLDLSGDLYDVVRVTASGYRYAVHADGTVTFYLGNTTVLDAEFAIKILRASVMSNDSNLQIREKVKEGEMPGTFSSICDFKYGSSLEVTYNFSMLRGKALDEVYFVMNGERLGEEIPGGFSENTLTYANSTNGRTISKTTDTAFTDDVEIYADLFNIRYKIKYYVYAAADDMDGIGDAPVSITEDVEHNEFIAYYDTETTLLNEETLLQLAADAGMDVSNVIYSGWYNKTNVDSEKKALSYDNNDIEGAALLTNGRYDPEKTFTHTTYQVHPEFRCYLINEFSFSSTGLVVNGTIKNTSAYTMHFSAVHPTVEIPSVYHGTNVTALGSRAFDGLTAIRGVELPSSVNEIGSYAFNGCTGLQTTGLTEYIRVIGQNAYTGCTSVETVEIGRIVGEIGNGAFSGMTNLKNVVYNTVFATNDSNMITLGTLLFLNSGGGTAGGYTLTVGENVSFVSPALFYESTNLSLGEGLGAVRFTEATGAKNVSIGTNAFAYSGIRTFTASDRIESFGDGVFMGCTYLESFDFEGATAITSVAPHMFDASGLKEVLFSEQITAVEEYAFTGCTKLASVYYRNEDGLASVGEGAFRNADGRTQALVRMIDASHKEEVDEGSTDYDEVRLENLTEIGDNAFVGCTRLKKIVFGGQSVVFGKTILAADTALKEIGYNVVNGTDRTESDRTFAGIGATNCALTIGENVLTIPNYVFYNLTGVKSVTVPSTVTRLGTRAFGMMSDLITVYFNLELTDSVTMGNGVFYNAGATSGLSIVFGENVTKVGANAFSSVSNLTSVTIPENADADFDIGSSAFSGTGVTSLSVPVRKSLKLGDEAFGSTPLATVSLNATIGKVTIGRGAFSSGNDARVAAMNVTAFGRTMTSLWGRLTSGTFVVTYDAERENYTATLGGQMNTTPGVNFTIGKEDEFLVDGGQETAVLTVYSTATVYGTLTKVNSGRIVRRTNATLKGVAFAKNDLLTKIALGDYTHMTVDATAESITLTEEQTVSMTGFADEKGISLDAAIEFRVTEFTVATGKTMMVNEGVTVTGTATGTFVVAAYTEVILGGKRYLNNGSAADSYGYGVCLTNGTAQLTSSGSVKEIRVANGGTLTANYAFTQVVGESIALLGTATFAAQRTVVLVGYSGGENATFNVNESGSIKFTGLKNRTLSASILSEVSMAVGNDVTYYGKLQNALSAHDSSDATYVLEKDVTATGLTLSEADTGETVTLDFNGHSLSLSGNIGITSGSLALSGADLTVPGIVQSNDDGCVTIGGTVRISNGSITTNGFVTIQQNAVVTGVSTSDTLISASFVDLYGQVTTSGNGIVVADNGYSTVGVSITGGTVTANGSGKTAVSVSANNATVTLNNATLNANAVGLSVAGENAGVTLSGNTQITASTAVRTDIVRTTKTTTAMTIASTASLMGTEAGLYIKGSGVYSVAGAVSATAERGWSTGTTATGALVAEETEGGNVRVTLTGSATNTNGDALVYIGREFVASSSGYGYFSINATNATVVGGVAEVKQVYETYVGTGTSIAEVYETDENGVMRVRPVPADLTGNRYVFYSSERIGVNGRTVYADLEVNNENITEETVRYLVAYATVEQALAGGGIVRYGGNYEINGAFDATLVTEGNVTVTADAEISGTVAVKSTGTISVEDGVRVTITGGVLAFDGNTARTVLTNNGETTVLGTIAIPTRGTLCNDGKFTLGNGATPYLFGSFEAETASELWVEGNHNFASDNNFTGAKLTIDGEVTMTGNTIFEDTEMVGLSGYLETNAVFRGTSVTSVDMRGGLTLQENAKVTLEVLAGMNYVKMADTATLIVNNGGTLGTLYDLQDTVGLFGTIKANGAISVSGLTVYGTLEQGTSLCSDTTERSIANDTIINVSCDCNVIGNVAETGYTSTIIDKKGDTITFSDDTIEALGEAIEAFTGFYNRITVTNEHSAHLVKPKPSMGEDRTEAEIASYTAFETFYTAVIDLYATASGAPLSEVSAMFSDSILVGINKPYHACVRNDDTEALVYEDLVKTIGRLFGVDDVSAFRTTLNRVLSYYRGKYNEYVLQSKPSMVEENGTFYYPAGKMFVLPYVFKSTIEGSQTTAALVFVDPVNNNVSVWLLDRKTADIITNKENVSYGEHDYDIHMLEVYGRCDLFDINDRTRSAINMSGGLTIEGGTVLVRGEMTVSGAVNVNSGKLVFAGEAFKAMNGIAVNGGKAVVTARSTSMKLETQTFTLASGAGLEHIRGKIKLKTGNDLTMAPGSWYYVDKRNGETVTYVTSDGADAEYAQTIYGFDGVLKGSVRSYCKDDHETQSFAETCATPLYTGCVYEVRAHLMGNELVEIKHDRAGVSYTDSMPHEYAAVDEEYHVCEECLDREPHVFNVMGLADTEKYSFILENRQAFLLSYFCEDCRFRSAPAKFATNATEYDVNVALKDFRFENYPRAARMSCGGYSKTRKAAENNIGVYTFDGTEYYLVEIFFADSELQTNRYFVLVECDEEKVYEGGTERASASGSYTTSVSTVGGEQCTLVWANGAKFDLTSESIVAELEAILEEVGLSDWKVFDGNYPASATQVMYTISTLYCDDGSSGLDLIKLQKGTSTMYATVEHVCHTFEHSGSAHVCADCGRADSTPHALDQLKVEAEALDGDFMLYCLYRYCPVCGEKERVFLSAKTITDAETELAGLGTLTADNAVNGNGETGTYPLTLSLSDPGTDLFTVYSNIVRLGTDGVFYMLNTAEYNGIKGTDYTVVFVKTEYNHSFRYPHVLAVLSLNVQKQEETKTVYTVSGDAVKYTSNGQVGRTGTSSARSGFYAELYKLGLTTTYMSNTASATKWSVADQSGNVASTTAVVSGIKHFRITDKMADEEYDLIMLRKGTTDITAKAYVKVKYVSSASNSGSLSSSSDVTKLILQSSGDAIRMKSDATVSDLTAFLEAAGETGWTVLDASGATATTESALTSVASVAYIDYEENQLGVSYELVKVTNGSEQRFVRVGYYN